MRIARLYGKIAPQVCDDSVFGIEPELGLALLLRAELLGGDGRVEQAARERGQRLVRVRVRGRVRARVSLTLA